MKLENKYSTVSQSKRLKELGIIQGKSERYWYTGDTGNNIDHLNITGSNYKDDDMCYSAFDVAELMLMMPALFNKSGVDIRIKYNGDATGNPGIWLWCQPNDCHLFNFFVADYYAVAITEGLIYLLENKLITPESVNDRLQNS